MCIRDRVSCSDAFSGREPVPTSLENAMGGLSSTPEPADDTCLLYTSDAADERSSVDLGGRRIIKKKRKEEETRKQYEQQRN